MIDLCELLFARGLPKDKGRTKIVRHTSSQGWDVEALSASGHLDEYQSNQGRPIFRNCDHFVSFIGEAGSLARLMGVYKITGVTENPTRTWKLPNPAMNPGRYWYDFEKQSKFWDLENRVVIDWGPATINWAQWLSEREVVEIRPTGYVREFPGFDNVLLSYGELCQIIGNPSANREWHRALSSVFGVYLITHTPDGDQYVGSAYGADGILSRWKDYAKTGHGGNRWLKPLKPADFQFSILRALPTTMTDKEVIAMERTYMKKLGSRAHGLNS